ncbi:metallophosphoesterase family protein [Bacillus carboniphilus]|uniref:Metallophosphoesterase family protein n=1 Tax=Bacillus carboniphilus TaxID=86663 RepID=A0ABY9JXT4_9BACI|nr:metallophosphoesterase family protein [Bacillus carboniphilus]WLR43143.1 metallophosphoesterase family protein [Bacillus carboniphilus]
MDRIAIISDIHGNLPALTSVLNDIRAKDIETIYCLGDIVGKGPNPKQAIKEVQKNASKIVQGNWDDMMTMDIEDTAIKWQQSQLSIEERQWLKSLPFSIELWISGNLMRLFHASPFSVHKRIQPWDSIEKRLSMFNQTDKTVNHFGVPNVIGYGDVHNAYLQNFSHKSLFNVGSVGNPLEIPQASYCIVEGAYQSRKNDSFSIQFIRVPYPIEETIQLTKASDMPEKEKEAFIKELKTAKYRGLK